MRMLLIQIMVLLVLTGVVTGCRPSSSADCENVCATMMVLYTAATNNNLARPEGGRTATADIPDPSLKDDQGNNEYYCPLNWDYPRVPFMEYYTYTHYISGNSYSADACQSTCEDLTYNASSPEFTEPSIFRFESCLRYLDVNPDGAAELFQTYRAKLNVAKECLNELQVSCQDEYLESCKTAAEKTCASAENKNLCIAQEITACIEDSCLSPRLDTCILAKIEAETRSYVKKCWLLQVCREELARFISGQERP